MKKLLSWVLVFGWMGVIYWLSDQSQLIPSTNPLLAQTIAALGHVIFFGILYILFTHAIKASYKINPITLFKMGIVFILLYGLSDEYHQSFVPGRDANILDVGLDLVGSVLASRFKA